MTEESSPVSSERVIASLTDYIQNGLLVNTCRISHVNELNKAAFRKYEKIAEATKSFHEKIEPLNEECIAIGEQLSALDKILDNITDMEIQVSELNSLVTSLGCFAVGTQNGFRIYNSNPLKLIRRWDFSMSEGMGVGFVEMLFRTNYLGILGGGRHPRIPSNTACVWDGINQKFILELAYSGNVRAVKLRKDRLVVVLDTAVKVYTFESAPQLLHQSETCLNTAGLCQVSQNAYNPIIAFPSTREGYVTIITSPENKDISSSAIPPPRHFQAHQNALAAMTFNADADLIATASEKGTLIRIFNTQSCTLLQELRRGTQCALITSISFDHNPVLIDDQLVHRLVVASDRNTVHIFRLKIPASVSNSSRLARSPLSQDSGLAGGLIKLNIFPNVSTVRIQVDIDCKFICVFNPANPDCVIVLGADGTYCKYQYTWSGAVTKEQSINILDFCNEEFDL
nr:WD40 repeat domain containing protein [Hymenolepis microstoma]